MTNDAKRLGTPSVTAGILRSHSFRAQKKYGQNFLIEPGVLEKIVEGAGVGAQDTVLEIGPGIGAMTQVLAETAERVIAVEIDRALLPILEETLQAYTNVLVLCEDILKVDLTELSETENQGRPFKVVANLPYNITTPVLMRLLEGKTPVTSITVMVQSEVAERMMAGPGSKEYGALSLAVQYRARLDRLFQVPPSCFIPRPGVESTVIHLTVLKKPPVSPPDEAFFFALVRAAFNERRKTLPNALYNAPGLSLPKEGTRAALVKMGLSENVRGEALSLEQFAELAGLLQPHA